ncbi:MAG: hypothetical protein JNK12_20995 [Acidimicrobiales bacterium]|nr:hypothetical protein [Acidimicrobiales bacterium]
MLRILVIITVFYLGFVALVAGSIAALLWSLRRRNRVSASTKTPAPVTWLVSPRSAARMHRRLRNALTSARVAYAPAVGEAHPQLPDLALTLEREAVLTDELLVAASTTPRPHRRRSLQPLQAQVTEIERLAHQIAHTARRAGPAALPQAADGLRDVADQLEALRAAQAEVEAVERLAQGRPDLAAPAAGALPPQAAPAPPATLLPPPPPVGLG